MADDRTTRLLVIARLMRVIHVASEVGGRVAAWELRTPQDRHSLANDLERVKGELSDTIADLRR